MSRIESFFFDKLNARTLTRSLEVFVYEDECIEDGEEDDMSTQFLRIQKKKSADRLETAFRAL